MNLLNLCTEGRWQKSYVGKICIGVEAINENGLVGISEALCNTILPATDEFYETEKDCIEANMSLMAASKQMYQTLVAIKALIQGEWDNQNLAAFGPLSVNPEDDIHKMVDDVLKQIQ